MSKSLFSTTLLMLFLSPNSSLANEEGTSLHNESCVACHIVHHDDAFYTRENRKITTHNALTGQVSRCVQAFSVGWFPDEEKSVVDYLNKQYYKFKR